MNVQIKRIRQALEKLEEEENDAVSDEFQNGARIDGGVKATVTKRYSKRGMRNNPERGNAFQLRSADAADRRADSEKHVYGRGVVCDTDKRGYATPKNRDIREIVVDASEGFIPLWKENVTLRWRFQERSLAVFEDPEAATTEIERLLGEAAMAWGDAAPIRFAKRDDDWDFEVVVRESDRCSVSGCVLASAFFPDAGRHELRIYPKMFEQSQEEQVETLIHEIGHVFGLRHFFAKVSETEFPSEVFGTHTPFSIMNYGEQSVLTDADKADLKRLYRMVWSGELTKINGTPIRLMTPFHGAGEPVEEMAMANRRPCNC